MQGVVFQTWLGENSTHPLSCIVASTRRGTTTDCDYPACGKRLSSRCRDQGGHPRRHHVTAGHVWTGQGRRSSEASVEQGSSASGGLRTWLRCVCTTLSELQFERGSLFPCSLDQTLFRRRWISFRDQCCLAPKKCLLEFTRFCDLGQRFQSFCPC